LAADQLGVFGEEEHALPGGQGDVRAGLHRVDISTGGEPAL
jgi:hypothetical protein